MTVDVDTSEQVPTHTPHADAEHGPGAAGAGEESGPQVSVRGSGLQGVFAFGVITVVALVHDVVIPGALQKGVSAVATVPAAASVSATENRAVVIVFVDQTTTIGNQPPTDTASSVKVALDKVDSRWLVSDFTPV
jgi:hypothetical protein